MEKPDQIEGVFDNGGVTTDRYCVVFNHKREAIFCCSDPGSPQGVSAYGLCFRTDRLGKAIFFGQLPARVQQHLIRRFAE